MKKLQLTFTDSLGKTNNLTIGTVKADLTEEIIRAQMVTFSGLGLFRSEEANLYVTPVGAKYIETIETDVF